MFDSLLISKLLRCGCCCPFGFDGEELSVFICDNLVKSSAVICNLNRMIVAVNTIDNEICGNQYQNNIFVCDGQIDRMCVLNDNDIIFEI